MRFHYYHYIIFFMMVLMLALGSFSVAQEYSIKALVNDDIITNFDFNKRYETFLKENNILIQNNQQKTIH